MLSNNQSDHIQIVQVRSSLATGRKALSQHWTCTGFGDTRTRYAIRPRSLSLFLLLSVCSRFDDGRPFAFIKFLYSQCDANDLWRAVIRIRCPPEFSYFGLLPHALIYDRFGYEPSRVYTHLWWRQRLSTQYLFIVARRQYLSVPIRRPIPGAKFTVASSNHQCGVTYLCTSIRVKSLIIHEPRNLWKKQTKKKYYKKND